MLYPWPYRQKRKERKQQRKLERQVQAEDRTDCPDRKRVRKEAEPSPLRLVIDCGFDDLMMLKVRPAPLAVQTFINDPVIQLYVAEVHFSRSIVVAQVMCKAMPESMTYYSGCKETSQADPEMLCREQTSSTPSPGKWLSGHFNSKIFF